MNESINDEAVYRTATATPGLLNTLQCSISELKFTRLTESGKMQDICSPTADPIKKKVLELNFLLGVGKRWIL